MAETVEKLTTGEPLTIDQLLEYLPALKEIPRAQLENWAKGAAVLHRYGKGEIVCEEGEFGSTAYYIVFGTVDIFIHNPLAHLRTHPVRNFLGRSMRRMKSFLTDDQTDLRPEAHQRKFIGIDANVDLPINRPLAQLGPGELFGEMTCRTYQPRSGMVRVSNALPGGEMVRTYLSRGDYFGEIGLLRSIKRTATCAALDAVDVVKIPAADFGLMVERFPVVRQQIEAVAGARLEAGQRKIPTGLHLDDFLNQGLFEAQNLLLIDLENCTRCDACVRACAQAHDGVSRLLRDGLRYEHFLVATACRSCRDPLCMTQCPVGSIRRKENLEIIVEDWCIGCGKCAELCPYGNINMHPLEVMKEVKTEIKGTEGAPAQVKIEKKKMTAYKANTCDLCTQLSTPSCVYACPHDAAKRVDPQRFFGDAITAQSELIGATWAPMPARYETHHTH